MHEDYNDDEYDDEHDYDDSQDYLESQYKHYFKFDKDAWDNWSKWLKEALDDIVEINPNVWYIGGDVSGFQKQKFPVNSYFSNTGKENSFQYLGSNYDGDKVWKKKYFSIDVIQQSYINHIQSHSVHFLRQPSHYKGMFDILN